MFASQQNAGPLETRVVSCPAPCWWRLLTSAFDSHRKCGYGQGHIWPMLFGIAYLIWKIIAPSVSSFPFTEEARTVEALLALRRTGVLASVWRSCERAVSHTLLPINARGLIERSLRSLFIKKRIVLKKFKTFDDRSFQYWQEKVPGIQQAWS